MMLSLQNNKFLNADFLHANFTCIFAAGAEARDRHLATSGSEFIQLQQRRKSRERNVAEEGTAFSVAAEEEVDDRKRDVGQVQDYARGITGEGELKAVKSCTRWIVRI